MSGTRLMSSASTLGRCFGDKSPDLVADLLRVGEKQPPLGAQDQKPLKGFVLGMFGRQRPQHVLSPLAADHIDLRIGGLAGKAD